MFRVCRDKYCSGSVKTAFRTRKFPVFSLLSREYEPRGLDRPLSTQPTRYGFTMLLRNILHMTLGSTVVFFLKRNYGKLLVVFFAVFLFYSFFQQKLNSHQPKDMSAEGLATDAYIRVADLNFTIPVVALLEPSYAFYPMTFSLAKRPDEAELKRRTEFKVLSSRAETAPLVDRVEIAINQYMYAGDRMDSVRICPLLTRDWARGFCTGELREMMKKLPAEFYIVDKERIDKFSSHFTVGRERVSDQIKSVIIKNSQSSIGCDADGRYCTGVTPVSARALAVWSIWMSMPIQTMMQQTADTQGAAIRAFVKYAIGPQPDFNTMKMQFDQIE